MTEKKKPITKKRERNSRVPSNLSLGAISSDEEDYQTGGRRIERRKEIEDEAFGNFFFFYFKGRIWGVFFLFFFAPKAHSNDKSIFLSLTLP